MSFPQRIALYFGALFLVYGVQITYFPVWLTARGLTPDQIGLITALPIVVRLVLTPAVAAYADHHQMHRTIVVWLSVGSLGLLAAVWASPSFPWLLLTVVPFAIAIITVLPLTETIAVAGLRAGGHDYGRMRLWGSLTFLAATLATGALFDVHGAPAIMAMLALAVAVTAVAALALPRPVAETIPRGEPDRGLVRHLMTQPKFVLFLLAVGAVQSSHAAFYTFGASHLSGQGVSGAAFGTLWAVAILAEMALFGWSARVLHRIGPVTLLTIGGLAALLRWGTMSLDPPYGVVLGLQALHALTYGATHLGAIHFIARAVPDRGAATAQALYSAIGNGLSTAIATYLAGLVYADLGGATFLVMGAIAVVGTLAAIALQRTWDGRAVI